jgi:DNA-binding response OmpR family regulator
MEAAPSRVLVVEDTLSNSRLLEAHLTGEGFAVVVVAEGRSAMTAIDEGPFDVVLLDVMLPGMDGFEVCRRIRQHRRAAATPVIMITALDVAEARQAARIAGADDFFVKPVEYPPLFATMRELIARPKSSSPHVAESALNPS